MTGTDVITNRARYILTDTTSGPNERWGNDILLVWLNDGQRLVAEVKPESLLSAPYTQTTYADAATIGATLVLPDRYREAMVDYVCARAFAQDAQDKQDLARADKHFQQFLIKANMPMAAVTGGRQA